MIKIAHRGNLYGPSAMENEPEYIISALSKGFDAEVDVWVIGEQIFSGHDNAEYLLDEKFLNDNAIVNHVWFHCKNLEALQYFANSDIAYKFFWHENDSYTLTSTKAIWTYPNREVCEKSIVVCFDKELPQKYQSAFAVCGDYVGIW
jgi:hypothetical protein